MTGGLSERLKVMQRALDVRTFRHQVLASNVANADTPHFKARDIDFKAALQGALEGRQGLNLRTTSARHLPGVGDGFAGASLLYRTETQSAVDGNTVDMDVERTQMAENAMQYEILTKLIGDRFNSMRSAVSSNQG